MRNEVEPGADRSHRITALANNEWNYIHCDVAIPQSQTDGGPDKPAAEHMFAGMPISRPSIV